jgi:hypothetical protein
MVPSIVTINEPSVVLMSATHLYRSGCWAFGSDELDREAGEATALAKPFNDEFCGLDAERSRRISNTLRRRH